MNKHWQVWIVVAIASAFGMGETDCHAQAAAGLPQGVKAVWDLAQAYRETTPTRERVCINGLWRWQPADPKSDRVPDGDWGYFKVPGCWPGITDYMQKDCQTVHRPSELEGRAGSAASRRPGTSARSPFPREWAGRRIASAAEYLNSYAAVYVDGKQAGEIRFPGGRGGPHRGCAGPGGTHVLSLLVVAMPLKGVMLSYSDTRRGPGGEGLGGAARPVRRRVPGRHARRAAHRAT